MPAPLALADVAEFRRLLAASNMPATVALFADKAEALVHAHAADAEEAVRAVEQLGEALTEALSCGAAAREEQREADARTALAAGDYHDDARHAGRVEAAAAIRAAPLTATPLADRLAQQTATIARLREALTKARDHIVHASFCEGSPCSCGALDAEDVARVALKETA